MDATSPSIVVLGNFDGVHIGHRALLKEAKRQKDALSLPITVWSFRALPGDCLTSPDQRRALLLACSADRVVFDEFLRVKHLSPEAFFHQIVRETLHAEAVICGFNYSFGHRGVGNAETLSALCREVGIPCLVVPEVSYEGETVSSTRIRALLREGKPEAAAALLGRPYLLSATVEEGRRFGRQKGVPTLNQAIPENLCLPKAGVYATFCRVGEITYPSVTNVGCCPTVTDGSRFTVETHLLDFEGDLYQKTVSVGFLSYLREEAAFPSADALYAEIQQNIEQARSIFGEYERTKSGLRNVWKREDARKTF